MNDRTFQVLGALALELAPGSGAAHDALPQQAAGALAAAIAHDLAGFAADAAALDLILVGAHYDPVELLRPGWPVHRELDQLGARAPGDRDARGRIIAFGSHEGRLPGALAPAADYAGGPLRLLPWVLSGEAETARRVGERFESELMEHGMAGAATALQAQEAFGLRIEHARYLTVHDLCALTAMQYEHAGLAPLWPILETALLSPHREAWLDAPPEPLLHYTDGEARIALLSPDAWRKRYAGNLGDDAERLQRAFAHFEARQRQLAAVLMAHGVTVTFAHCGGDPVQEL
ncbi:hypothetical protein [Luteimonas aquatica]|uniref:hypothetical protein n=1 Tax=Luteimonas aquatica TaxID=450364 RepID=UPI001F5A17EE|nr:hypothetical protein [Luteimonas aquatica]